MKQTYVIDKGVTIPFTGKWAQLADIMDVGDSVLLNTRDEACGLCRAIRKAGWEGRQRKEGDKFRVWLLDDVTALSLGGHGNVFEDTK